MSKEAFQARLAVQKLRRAFYKNYSYKDESFFSGVTFYKDEQTTEYYQWKFITPDNVIHTWRYLFSKDIIEKDVVA